MTEAENMKAAGDQLLQGIKLARWRSRCARARARAAMEAAAETEEYLAGALDRLAIQLPHRARRLAALSKDARRQAAIAWQWGGRT